MKVRYVENAAITIPMVGRSHPETFWISAADAAAGSFVNYAPSLVRSGTGYIAIHPFLTNWSSYYGSFGCPVLNPLSPTNGLYYTTDYSDWSYLGSSPEFPNWDSLYACGSAANVSGQPIQDLATGALINLLAVPAFSPSVGASGNLVGTTPFDQTSWEVSRAVWSGPYVCGVVTLTLAAGDAAATLTQVPIPWGGRVGGTQVSLLGGGLDKTVFSGVTALNSWAWRLYARLEAMGYPLTAGARGNWVVIARDNGVRAVITAANVWLMIDILDGAPGSLVIGSFVPSPSSPLWLIEGKGTGSIVQIGRFVIFGEFNSTVLLSTLQVTSDLITWSPVGQNLPFVPSVNNPPYSMGASDTDWVWEVRLAGDTIHQLWVLNLPTQRWRLFDDWTAAYYNQPGTPNFAFGEGNVGLGLFTVSGRSFAFPGAISDADSALPNTPHAAVAYWTGGGDPHVTGIGFASTRNFVLSKRALAYYQRIGFLRLAQEYL